MHSSSLAITRKHSKPSIRFDGYKRYKSGRERALHRKSNLGTVAAVTADNAAFVRSPAVIDRSYSHQAQFVEGSALSAWRENVSRHR